MPIGSDGRWFNGPDPMPAGELASAARVAGTAQSTPFDVDDADSVIATLNVTNINGGTVTPSLEVSYDGTNYDQAGAWPLKNANGTHRRKFDVKGASKARWAWTVATATVTFRISSVDKLRGR